MLVSLSTLKQTAISITHSLRGLERNKGGKGLLTLRYLDRQGLLLFILSFLPPLLLFPFALGLEERSSEDPSGLLCLYRLQKTSLSLSLNSPECGQPDSSHNCAATSKSAAVCASTEPMQQRKTVSQSFFFFGLKWCLPWFFSHFPPLLFTKKTLLLRYLIKAGSK